MQLCIKGANLGLGTENCGPLPQVAENDTPRLMDAAMDHLLYKDKKVVGIIVQADLLTRVDQPVKTVEAVGLVLPRSRRKRRSSTERVRSKRNTKGAT
jgi:hypothetical protein